jgi:hypothetical protein
LGILVLSAYVVAASLITIKFAEIQSDTPDGDRFESSQSDADLGIVVKDLTLLQSAVFTDENPSLDVMLDDEGALSGYLRVATIAIEQKTAEAQIGLVLPSRARVHFQDASGHSISIGEHATDHHSVSCSPDEYPASDQVGDARDAGAMYSLLPDEKLEVDCVDGLMFAWYTLPKMRKEGELLTQLDGTRVGIGGVGMVAFQIPRFKGAIHENYSTWKLEVAVDSVRRAGTFSLHEALSNNAALSAEDTSFGLITDDDHVYADMSPEPTTISPRFYFDKPRTMPIWSTSFDSYEYFSATVENKDKLDYLTLVSTLFWVAVGIVVPLGVTAATWLVRHRNVSPSREISALPSETVG